MQLTVRDREVVKAVYEYRFLRQDQIQALLFPSKWSAQYRLIRLYQHRYLKRVFTAVPFGRGKTVYCLDGRGADLLAAELGVDRGIVSWQRKDNRVGSQFLEHTLAVNDVRIALERAGQAVDGHVEDWADEHDLRRRHSQPGEVVYIPGAGGKKYRAAVIPDGYFVLRWYGKKAHFFLEVDLATIANKRWMRKVRAYSTYYRSGKYQAKYGTRSLHVLTVTTSQKRLANLKATTEQADGGAMFWFTTFDLMNTDNALTAPIWQVAGREGSYPVIQQAARPPVLA